MSIAQRLATLKAQAIPLREQRIAYDLVLVCHVASAGWILEKICKVVEAESGLHCAWIFSEQNHEITEDLPAARAYFFAHYALAHHALLKRPEVHAADRYVWFTHPDPTKSIPLDDLVATLAACTHVFVPNSEHYRLLQLLGLPAQRMSVVLGGADPQLFAGHPRGKGAVGFVGAYYPRKNPEAMIRLIEAMPEQRFILLAPASDTVVNQGLGWRSFDGFDRLSALPNLTYVEADYAAFPRWYREMDVFVSVSSLEGGPIPLIEAMMSNVFPVVTRTGFAEDLIENGRNGYLVPVGCGVAQVAARIRDALQRTEVDVRATGLDYSWSQFGRVIAGVMNPKLRVPGQLSLAAERPTHRVLRGGWHLPETDGVWSEAEDATIAVPLSGARPGPHRVRLTCWSVLGAVDPDETVTVLRDGHEIASRIVPAEPFRLDALVWLNDADPDAPLLLTLRVSRLASPAQLGVADDGRMLGVKVGAVAVSPMDLPVLPISWRLVEQPLPEGVLACGWHTPERFGVWSAAPMATLRLPIGGDYLGGADPTSPCRLVVAMRGRAHGVDTLGPQRLRLQARVTGSCHEIEHRVLDDALRWIEVPVDIAEPGIVEISIGCARLARPVDLDPRSHDRRQLGFLLTALELRVADVVRHAVDDPAALEA